MKAADALLAAQTLEALEKGTSAKTTEMVKSRLLAKDELMEDGTLKPYVELVLINIRDVARKSGRPEDKHQAIQDWLVLGGF